MKVKREKGRDSDDRERAGEIHVRWGKRYSCAEERGVYCIEGNFCVSYNFVFLPIFGPTANTKH